MPKTKNIGIWSLFILGLIALEILVIYNKIVDLLGGLFLLLRGFRGRKGIVESDIKH